MKKKNCRSLLFSLAAFSLMLASCSLEQADEFEGNECEFGINGSYMCNSDLSTVMNCQNGSYVLSEDCLNGTQCNENYQCAATVCTQNDTKCINNRLYTCRGSKWVKFSDNENENKCDSDKIRGDKVIGESCVLTSECKSGVCVDGRCAVIHDGVLAAPPIVNGKNITFEVKLAPGYEIAEVIGGAAPIFKNTTVTDTVTENNRYNYRVKIVNSDKKAEIYVPVWVEDKPFDWHDALLYFAFTDRFADGDPANNAPATDATVEGTANTRWLGGDFKGLKAKVEEGYFDRLGVNSLWISSVSMNTQTISWGSGSDAHHSYSAYHSYWPISTFMTEYNQSDFGDIKAVEPHFGTMDDLKALVDACHKRGIRVLVDFVANHVHKESPIFINHKDWFNGDLETGKLCNDYGGWENLPETCWFSRDLPDINYNLPEPRQLMVDHAAWLIKEIGIDGFRVDAAKHLAIQFLKDLRTETNAIFANSGSTFYMVGETFDTDSRVINQFIGPDLLHAQFDFMVYFAIKDMLKTDDMSKVAAAGIFGSDKLYNSDLMSTFIGSHDVARAISVAAGQNDDKWNQAKEITAWEPYFKAMQAMTIILTNPGIPMIYYGDEFGMPGGNDPDNRRMMKFGKELNPQQEFMLSFVQKLGKIRSEHTALTRGRREDLTVEAQKWCYKLSDGTESIIVGIGSVDAGGTCSLKGNYNLQSLIDPGKTLNNVQTLNFDKDKYQIYLVK